MTGKANKSLDELILNAKEATEVINSLPDPVTRNLVRVAYSHLGLRLAMHAGMSQAEWEARLPAAPFDLKYFVEVLAVFFAKKDLLTALLSGESIAKASGWDDGYEADT